MSKIKCISLSLIFLLFFFVAPEVCDASNKNVFLNNLISQSFEKELWKEVQWLRLLHYRKHFSGYKSQTDGLPFFLSGKRGMKDPKAEMEATLRGFFSMTAVKKGEEHPQCMFPARFLWLKSKLKWDIKKDPAVACEKFNTFRERLAAKSVTLVFSSYFLNNPSSAFGHTLIKINKRDRIQEGSHNALLDYGINYSATVTTNNPILYAITGLSGGFHGVFSNIPYYYKVREYNDSESRDLWEYELNLTQDEVDMLVAHFWELGHTYFDYYYLTENCSYHMLTALEAATPEYNLVDKLPFYIIPADTVKIVNETPNLVSDIQYRPSARSEFYYQFAKLTRTEKSVLKKIVLKREVRFLPDTWTLEEKAKLLDVVIDYYDYKKFKKVLEENPIESRFKQKLLVARSALRVSSPPENIPAPNLEAPHEGHDPARIGVGGGASTQTGPFVLFSHRFALHDLADPREGYPEYAQIEFLEFTWRKNIRESGLWLENASLFKVLSFSDWSSLDHRLSWKFRVGAETFRDLVCHNCLGPIIEGGFGMTKKLVQSVPTSITITVDGEGTTSPKFLGPDARFRYGPWGLIRTSLLPNLQIMVSGKYRLPLISRYSSNSESAAQIRWGISRNIALDFQAKHFWKPNVWEETMGFFFYF